jgi:pyrroloquinoline quinone (PQQ) biosynthesis protein C
MEKWLAEKYQSPSLINGEISKNDDAQLVTLNIGNGQLIDLHIDGLTTEKLEDTLHELKNPASSIWKEVKDQQAASWIYSLVKQLDDLSLIEETFVSQRESGDLLEQIEAIVQRSVVLLSNNILSRLDMYRPHLDTVKALLFDIQATSWHSIPFQWMKRCEGNFALQSIALQISFGSKNFPEMLTVWRSIFMRLLAQLNEKQVTQQEEMEFSFSQFNMTDARNVETYALSFVHFLTLSPLRVGKRLTHCNLPPPNKPSNGLAVVVAAERALTNALQQLGVSSYSTALAEQLGGVSPLVQGIYVEQFHVTYRFVEIIGPLLTRRFKTPLRSRLFNYFQEEFGHEEYELETCIALGLNRTSVENAIPLPLTTIYIDTYSVLAQEAPLAFMLALMVTEGMLEQENPLHRKLHKIIEQSFQAKDIASKHHDVNEDLHHSSLTRLFLSEVQYLSPQQQEEMLQAALFVLELNFRALEEVAIFYADKPQFKFCSLNTWGQTHAA